MICILATSSLIGLSKYYNCCMSLLTFELRLTVSSLRICSFCLRCSSISLSLFYLRSFSFCSNASNCFYFSASKSWSSFLTLVPYSESMSANCNSISGLPLPCLRLKSSSFRSYSETTLSRFCANSASISLVCFTLNSSFSWSTICLSCISVSLMLNNLDWYLSSSLIFLSPSASSCF